MGSQGPIIGMVFFVRSQEWGDEVFVLVDQGGGVLIPEGYQPVNLRARFGEFLLTCAVGERRLFVGYGGEAVEYEIIKIIRPS